MHTSRITLSLLLLALLPWAATAEIYKYVDENGVIRYTDTPPSKEAKPVELPPVQTYSNDGVSYDSGETQATPEGLLPEPANYTGIELIAPTPEQVFNQAEPQVSASANVQPGLAEGHRVVFFVDGQPFPAPAGQASVALENLERGSHTLQAVVLDSRDAALIQSETINFHLHQPSRLRPSPPGAMPKLP